MRNYAINERPEQWTINPEGLIAQAVFFGGGYNPGTVKYWDGDGEGRRYPNHGTLTGYTGAGNLPSQQWSRALGRPCLGFNGSGDGVGPFSVSGLPTGSSKRTVSLWFKATGNTTNVEMMTYGSTNTAGHRFSPWITSSSQIGIENVGSATLGTWTSDQKWHHFSATLTGSNLQSTEIWIDGKRTTNSYGNTTTINTDNYLYLGRLHITGNDGYQFTGFLSDIIAFPFALSSGQIAALADPSNVMLSIGTTPGLLPIRRAMVGYARAASVTSLLLYRRRRMMI